MFYIFMAEILTNNFQFQGQTSVSSWALIIGLIIAIILIVTLIVVIVIISKFITISKGNSNSIKFADSSVDKSKEASPVNIVQSTEPEDLTLIAVITAAIAAMLSSGSASNTTYPGFKVRKIRRVK